MKILIADDDEITRPVNSQRHSFTTRLLLILVSATVLLPQVTRAEEEEKPEIEVVEPILTEETLPNEPKELSLRLTTDYRKKESEVTGLLPQVDLFYGLAERFGLELSVPLAYHKGEEGRAYGVGDISLGLKYVVVEHHRNLPAIVVGLEAGFPTGNRERELGEGAYELTPSVALLKDFGPFNVQGNFGWARQVTGEREEQWNYNWALAVPLFKRKAHLLAELNGDWGHHPSNTFSPGFKYELKSETTIGLAIPIGISRGAPDWGIVAQFQIGVGR
jgi:Putative MetA-pathway of phenol degradation